MRTQEQWTLLNLYRTTMGTVLVSTVTKNGTSVKTGQINPIQVVQLKRTYV